MTTVPTCDAALAEPLYLDFETTNLDKGSPLNPKNRIVLAAWFDGEYHYCFGDQYHQQRLVEAVNARPYICAQNAKFELQWLSACGVDTYKVRVYDTMVAQKTIASNRHWPLDLASIASHYALGGKHSAVHDMITSGVCPSVIDPDLLLRYCLQDVALLRPIRSAQLAIMGSEGPTAQVRMGLTPVLAETELVGMMLARYRVDAEHDRLRDRQRVLYHELETLAPGVLITSAKQLAAFLYDDLAIKELKDRFGKPEQTRTGKRKTDASTIKKLRPSSQRGKDFVAAYTEGKRVSSALSKYITKMKACCAAGGVLYGRFNQCIASTGRLSSSGAEYKIQLQNMNKDYKKLFCAHEGYELWEVDLSQIEFRVAADLSRDPSALKDIAEGFDIHAFTAEQLTAAGQPTDRDAAKQHTFKPLYGGQTGTKAEKEYYKAFRERYPQMYLEQQRWTTEVLATGQLTTALGHKFYWPGTTVSQNGYIANSTKIFDYPIQWMAGDVIMSLIIQGLSRTMPVEATIINTVHDSVVLEVYKSPEAVAKMDTVLLDIIGHQVYTDIKSIFGYDLKVPLGYSVKRGSHWGEGQEVKYEVSL